ncbi:hypothetical protein [Natrinema salaciae]|uniref:Transcriptional regulator PadR-like family protein n=1 Tax=Natrinema salaciae TaxID=1186196 RepID=A0A1H9CFV1_9EURY|nr:hypothetical protein [Natrinema salaciae]SEQ00024.1 hypothetical protein SAMN04489841_1040 [Natrinema salaciae]
MHDDTSWDLESPARADASSADRLRVDGGLLRADGGTTWADLTAFQRDCLEAVARCERDGKRCDEAGIGRELEDRYPNLDHDRLYPTLTVLVGHRLLERRERAEEGRVEYVATSGACALLLDRAERLAETCGLVVVDRAGDSSAREAGDG